MLFRDSDPIKLFNVRVRSFDMQGQEVYRAFLVSGADVHEVAEQLSQAELDLQNGYWIVEIREVVTDFENCLRDF